MTLLPDEMRLRLVTPLLAVGCLSQIGSLPAATLACAAVFLLALAQKQPPPWRRLLHLEAFLILLFLTLPFTIPGRPVFEIGPLTASTEGVAQAAIIALKVSAAVLLIALFLAEIDPVRLGAALRGLAVPEALVRLFLSTARYLWLIQDEARRLQEAMRARGVRPRSNRHTWRSYGNLVGMLLVRGLGRAERIEEAMRCRGYTGQFPQCASLAASPRDWVAAGFIISISVALLLWERLWLI